jgi:ribosome-binding protein aMBF1 (putative translation factor)
VKISGLRIQVQRREYGISRAELAEKLGWKESLLADIEAGVAETSRDCGRWIMDALTELAEKKFDEL